MLCHMTPATPTPVTPRGRRLPLAGVLRLGRPADIWFKPALSVVASVAPPNLTLLALGRLDLAMYTMAGSLCALYAHNRPYAARARVLARVVLGMVGGLAVALVTASLTGSAVVLVTVGALLAAAAEGAVRRDPHRSARQCGPRPSSRSASLFAPQTLGQVPGHLALALGGGRLGLARRHGPRPAAPARPGAPGHRGRPERRGRVRRHAGTGDGHARNRATAAAAVQAAWQSLLATRGSRTRRALEHLVVRAEVALAAPADTDPEQLRSWARELTGTRPVPVVLDPVATDELLGVDAELAVPPRPLRQRLGPLTPIAVRTALGCALAGYASLALGIGRPYWALVTAASLYQANLTLTWSRGVQRVVGNLVGVLLFAAVAPLAHLGQAALVLCCLAFNFGAEALIGRNYWLGSVCVTPMALLVTEFTGFQQPGRADHRAGRGHRRRRPGRPRRGRRRHQPARRRPRRARPGRRRALPRARRPPAGRARPRPRRPAGRPPLASPPPWPTCAPPSTRRPASGGSAPCPRSGSCAPSRPDTVRSRRRYGTRGRSRSARTEDVRP